MHVQCMYVSTYISAIVIRESDDATVCEGGSTTFTCVLDRNHRSWSGNVLNSDNVQWYRVMTSTIGIIRVDPQGSNIHFTTSTTNNILTTNLTITNVIKSYTGYYWVGTPYNSVCNVSLTVTTSMCVIYCCR